MSFRALQVTQQTENGAVTAHEARVRTLDDDALEPADVEVDVQYSALNYKDGLALAGRPGVLRTSLVCGRHARVAKLPVRDLEGRDVYIGNSLRGLIRAKPTK